MIGAIMLLSKLDRSGVGGGHRDPPGVTLQRMLLKKLNNV